MPIFGPDNKIRFKQSDAADVVLNRVRILPDGTLFDRALPYDEVLASTLTPDAQGYVEIRLGDLPKAAGLDGRYDTFVTAVDDAGGESPPLEIADQDFDFEPPAAPTDGSIV
jgi:hypothetical protein